MSQLPRPIFVSYEIFIDQDFSSPEPGMVCVRVYLDSFEPMVEAHKGYLAVRSFLRSFSDNSFTFTSYRTHVERMLLWSMLVKRKPFSQL